MKLTFLLLLILSGSRLNAAALQVPSLEHSLVVENDVAVPMRDGVSLRADIIRPHGNGPFPVLVYRTPYGKEFALKEYTTFRHAVDRVDLGKHCARRTGKEEFAGTEDFRGSTRGMDSVWAEDAKCVASQPS